MSEIMFANKLQYEVLTTDSRITVVTAEPGAGSTTALVVKGIKKCLDTPNTCCSLFVPTVQHAINSGGVVSLIKSFVGDSTRFSQKSLIFTFSNNSKIKIISCSGDWALEASMGLSRDLLLFDCNIPDKFIVFHLPRAYEAVVVDNISEIEKEDSWANQLNLLKKDGDRILGFVEGIAHIRGNIEDNYLFKDKERYKELVKSHAPWRMRTEF